MSHFFSKAVQGSKIKIGNRGLRTGSQLTAESAKGLAGDSNI